MRVLLLALLGLPVLVVATALPAQALSCRAAGEVIANARVVYSGTVIDSADGRVLVKVDEIWKGEPIEDHQWLRVDLVHWSAWGKGESTLPDGISDSEPMVFAPSQGAVNPCSAFGPDMPGVREHRPDQPTAPVSTATKSTPIVEAAPVGGRSLGPVPIVAGGVALLALAGLAWWRFRPSGRGR